MSKTRYSESMKESSRLVRTRHGCNAFPVPGKRLSWEEMMSSVFLRGGELGMVLEGRACGRARYSRVAFSGKTGWVLESVLEEL